MIRYDQLNADQIYWTRLPWHRVIKCRAQEVLGGHVRAVPLGERDQPIGKPFISRGWFSHSAEEAHQAAILYCQQQVTRWQHRLADAESARRRDNASDIDRQRRAIDSPPRPPLIV